MGHGRIARRSTTEGNDMFCTDEALLASARSEANARWNASTNTSLAGIVSDAEFAAAFDAYLDAADLHDALLCLSYTKDF